VPEGPYQGCVVVNGGWAIDCDYAPIEWGEGTPSPALPAEEAELTPENTVVVFDDRDSVVKMWRDAGFHVHQVAEGNF